MVVAWGSHLFAASCAKTIQSMLLDPLCLGTTKNGSPRHPLYVAGTQPLIPWEAPEIDDLASL